MEPASVIQQVQIVEKIRQELKQNEIYLRQINRFYSAYQDRTYKKLYELLDELSRTLRITY